MLTDNEFIYIKSYCCETVWDKYGEGEVGDVVQFWDGRDFDSTKGKFRSVEESLKAVMDDNGLNWNGMGNWLNMFNETGDEFERGRFDTDILVNEDNFEPTEKQLKKWRKGNEKLYCLHISVRLGIRAERELTDDEHSELI